VLSRDGIDGLYCYPSVNRPAIDAGGRALLGDIECLVGRFPPSSDEREELLVALYGRSETLKIDSEGRVVLTELLKSHAGIVDAVTFVGLGQRFQMWEPERFRAHLEKATATLRSLTDRLGLERGASGDGAREW
jgi:MraZ protein